MPDLLFFFFWTAGAGKKNGKGWHHFCFLLLLVLLVALLLFKNKKWQKQMWVGWSFSPVLWETRCLLCADLRFEKWNSESFLYRVLGQCFPARSTGTRDSQRSCRNVDRLARSGEGAKTWTPGGFPWTGLQNSVLGKRIHIKETWASSNTPTLHFAQALFQAALKDMYNNVTTLASLRVFDDVGRNV